MKIHSDVLNVDHFRAAAKYAGVSIIWETFNPGGSRSRKQSFVVHLSGSSSYRAGFAGNNGYLAATWDEWGMFLAHLFDVDPDAHCGKNSYLSAAHFHWVTDDRFRGLTPPYQHRRHKWIPMSSPIPGSPNTTRNRGFYEHWCDCGATQRQVAYGKTWAEVAA